MFFKGTIRSVTEGRSTAIFVGKVAAILSIPVIAFAIGTPSGNPQYLAHTGAPGQGTCGSCHGTFTPGTGVTVNAPTTYTPSGAAVTMTVTIPSTGGFELAVLTQSGNAQAGMLTAGSQDGVTTVGSIQYVASSTETTSWSFQWTPPANVGNVVVYVTGGNYGTNYSNSYVIPPAVIAPPPATLAAMPTSLTFNMSGSTPSTQPLQITSGGSPIMVTSISVSPATATWLSVMPPGGNTPVMATVGINGTPAAGTYNANIVITASGASNSPLSVPVTLNVTAQPPVTLPTLNLSSTGLNFTTTVGGTVMPQNVMVTTSDGSSVAFNASTNTTSGGDWLSVGTTTGTTPTTQPGEPISVTLPSPMTAGTYQGKVTFTSSAVSNSPVSLPVTLSVTSATPPPPPTTGGETFSLVVVDRQSGGSDWLLLDGSGSINASGQPSGSGFFARFRSGSNRVGGATSTIVSSGTWTPISVMSYTPISGSTTGGTLVLQVQISTHGRTATSTGTLTITSTGSSAGVTLAMNGGATFTSVGIGTESMTHGSTGGGSGGGGGEGGGTIPPTPSPTPPPTTDN
jgi:hypothetical protein